MDKSLRIRQPAAFVSKEKMECTAMSTVAHPTFADVLDARRRLSGQARITPVMTSTTLDRETGAKVFLKCENLQRVGAFKFRGAYNAASRLSEKERSAGILTYSSGNHAQAVALAGRLLGVKTTIIMPDDAPAVKRAATGAYGAEIVSYTRGKATREAMAESVLKKRAMTLIPPFDHPMVIAGQGTAALELLESTPDLDYLLVPCGGGGLLSGSALAVKGTSGACRVVGVEPELGDDAVRSFRTKTLQRVENPQTIADGTRTESLGEITFPLVLQYVDDMVTVTEEAIGEAVRFLFYRMKLVVEPSGALGAAALLSGAFRVSGKVGVILSGGNMDGATAAAVLTAGN
jgi:threonine dehydratase